MSNWDGILEEFAADMITEKNFSQNSIHTYHRIIKEFIRKLEKLDISTDLADMTENDLKAWKMNLMAEKTANNTKRHKHSIIKSFFAWYAKKNDYPDPTRAFRPIPEEIKDIFVPTPSEVAQMIVAAGTDSFVSRRNAAIICLFAGAGPRVSELQALKFGDIIKTDKSFEVEIPFRKTRSRVVPFGDLDQLDILSSTFGLYYVELIAKRVNKNHPLFYNEDTQEALSSQTMWNIVRASSQDLNSNKQINPKTLRHFFATYLYIAGEDIRQIQKYMGHAFLSTTERYIHVAARIKSKTTKIHPLHLFKRTELTQINPIIKKM